MNKKSKTKTLTISIIFLLFAFECLTNVNADTPTCSSRNRYIVGNFNADNGTVVTDTEIELTWSVARTEIANPQYDCIRNFTITLETNNYYGIVIKKINFPASEFPTKNIVLFEDMLTVLMVENMTNIPFRFVIFVSMVNETWSYFNQTTIINGIYHYDPLNQINSTTNNYLQDFIDYFTENPLIVVSVVAIIIFMILYYVNKKKTANIYARMNYY